MGRPHIQHHALADEIVRFLLIGFHGFGGFAQGIRGLIFGGNAHTFACGK